MPGEAGVLAAHRCARGRRARPQPAECGARIHPGLLIQNPCQRQSANLAGINNASQGRDAQSNPVRLPPAPASGLLALLGGGGVTPSKEQVRRFSAEW